MPADWQPPVPAWAGDFALPAGTIVIAYFGTQGSDADRNAHLSRMNGLFAAADGPEHVERAVFTDRVGARNTISTAYWTRPDRYGAWRSASGYEAWWRAPERTSGEAGHFEEILRVPPDRFETLFSTETAFGAARTCPHLRGPIREHNYWGAMRDRIALSAGDDLASRHGEALPRWGSTASRGRRLRIVPPENLTLIRSGKDWSGCRGAELATFERSLRPVWVAGMDYLRGNPDETGCCDMRPTDEIAADGTPLKKSAGVGYFLTLGHLERWAEFHPTHLAIFNTFLAMAKELKQLDLKLWHEVSVLPAAGQLFEYVNCHPETGLIPYFPANESDQFREFVR